jgi:hypothetical protein
VGIEELLSFELDGTILDRPPRPDFNVASHTASNFRKHTKKTQFAPWVN